MRFDDDSDEPLSVDDDSESAPAMPSTENLRAGFGVAGAILGSAVLFSSCRDRSAPAGARAVSGPTVDQSVSDEQAIQFALAEGSSRLVPLALVPGTARVVENRDARNLKSVLIQGKTVSFEHCCHLPDDPSHIVVVAAVYQGGLAWPGQRYLVAYLQRTSRGSVVP